MREIAGTLGGYSAQTLYAGAQSESLHASAWRVLFLSPTATHERFFS